MPITQYRTPAAVLSPLLVVRDPFPDLSYWANNPDTREVGLAQRSHLREQFLADNPAPSCYRHVRWNEHIRPGDRLLSHDGTSIAGRLDGGWIGSTVCQFLTFYAEAYKENIERITIVRSTIEPVRERRSKKSKIKAGLPDAVRTKVNGRFVRKITL